MPANVAKKAGMAAFAIGSRDHIVNTICVKDVKGINAREHGVLLAT